MGRDSIPIAIPIPISMPPDCFTLRVRRRKSRMASDRCGAQVVRALDMVRADR